MPLADIVLSTEAIIVISGLMAALATAVTVLYREAIVSRGLRQASTETELGRAYDRIREMESVQKSYKEIAEEAGTLALNVTNFYREKDGIGPILPLVKVIPESHSPSTQLQRDTADIQTMRALMAQIKLEIGMEPRPTPPEATHD